MVQETFFDKVRDFIGGIAWAVFLWSIKMTEDEYLDSVVRESGLTQRAPDVCNVCGANIISHQIGKPAICSNRACPTRG